MLSFILYLQLHKMEIPNWGDLPPELLMKIATSCRDIENLMRGVCKPWKLGLEATSRQLTISGSALPLDLGMRFTALARLNLHCCAFGVTPRCLRNLQALPSVTSLTLKLLAAELNGEMLGALHGLPLAVLAVELAAGELTDGLVGGLRSLNLARLDLELAGERDLFEDAHLGRLAGRFYILSTYLDFRGAMR